MTASGRFLFRDDCSCALPVALTACAGGLDMFWPQVEAPEWDTALLQASVTTGATDQCPHVSIQSGTRLERQYFAPDDKGLRWLNLSFLRGSIAAGDRVTLRAKGMYVATDGAFLRLFANQPDLTKPILVLAPHPDDAEIAAFGLYAGHQATVVTVTAGNAGPAIPDAIFTALAEMYTSKGSRRVIDSVTAPWYGEIPPERCFNLGYFDGRLDRMYATPREAIPEMHSPNLDTAVFRRYNIGSLLSRETRPSIWHNLIDDLVEILHKVQPFTVVAPHPQLDSHPDHQFTSVALSEALVRWEQPVSVLLYTNHSGDDTYPHGPAGTVLSLPTTTGQMKLDGVYSHRVSPGVQKMKSFALESHYEVRTFDRTYLTRAVRSNELFYVYDEQSFKSLTDAFLAARQARHYSQQATPSSGARSVTRGPQRMNPEKAVSADTTFCSLTIREFGYPLDRRDAGQLAGFIKDIEQQYRVNLSFKYPAYWNWLYKDARSLVLEDGERVVGHVGCVPFRAIQDGLPKQGTWSVDTFLLSEYRGGGQGRRLQLAAQERSNLFSSVWMSPANSHIKLSMGQEIVATLEVLCRSRKQQHSAPTYLAGPPEPLQIAEAASLRLRDWGFFVERSPEYCAWRFVDQPSAGYTQVNCGQGVALTRRCGPQRGRAGMIGDAFPEDSSHEALETLLEAASGHLFDEGCESVRFGCTDPSAVELLLKGSWSHSESMRLHVPKGAVSGSVFLSLSDQDIDQYPW